MTTCIKSSLLFIPVVLRRPSCPTHTAPLARSLLFSNPYRSLFPQHQGHSSLRYISSLKTVSIESSSLLKQSIITPPPLLFAKESSERVLLKISKAKFKTKVSDNTSHKYKAHPSPPPDLPTVIVTVKSRDSPHLPTQKRFKVKNNKASKSASTAPPPTHEAKKSFKRNKQPRTHRTPSHFPLNKKMAAASVPSNFDDGSQMSENEALSSEVQILCEAFAEANIRRARQYPPVFLIGTYEQAELAMQIFTEYYQLTAKGLEHVGFDTETECHWDNPSAQRDEVSIIQMASQDVCLLFQINRIVNFARQPFPPRLKAFLENPNHLKLGVGAKRDAKDLDRVFKIHCNGVVDLETLALEKHILERSLQDLDEMYGRPGREVYKTNAMLRWKWNAEDLQPQWIWYAAKDAFAGIAIYENMMADRVKDTFKPYEERFPMTEAELKKDVMSFLERAMGGKGRQTTLGAVETTIQKGYGRFQKMYQPQDRVVKVKSLVRDLITSNLMTRLATTPLSEAHKEDILVITGERLERVLRTQEAINVLRPYFNNAPVFAQSLSTKGITLPQSLEEGASSVNGDFEDLRLFVELGSMWQQPRKLNGMTSSFLTELEAAGYQGLPPPPKFEPGAKPAEKKIVATNVERAKTNEIGAKWRAFINRLVRRRVLATEGGMYAMNQDLEERCREAAPELPREVIDPAETKRQKAFRRTAITEARLSTVTDLTAEEDLGPGAQKRIRMVSDDTDGRDEAESQQDGEQDEGEEMSATASKRAASPQVDSTSGTGKEMVEPPKKRGRTTRRSMAIQAEEDAAAAAAAKDKEGDGKVKEEEGGKTDEHSDKSDAMEENVKKEKTKKEKVAEEKATKEKDAGDDEDVPKVKKEEETDDEKKPLQLPDSHHAVLEKGHAFFFYRPKMDVDQPSGTDDVQKLYMLLSPDAAIGRVSTDSKYNGSTSPTASKKAESDGHVKKEDGSEEALHRLLIIPRKALPVNEPSGADGAGGGSRSNKPGSRNWAFVDITSPDLATVEARLKEYTYSTKTRGERTQPSARFIAEARYEIILDHVDPEHPQRQSSHFVYALEVPQEPGPVQNAFNIKKEGQFMIQVKNPQIQTPATERGAVRYATLKEKAAQLPQHLQEKFRGVRKDQVRYTPLDSTEFLDVAHTELVLLALKRGAKTEFEELLKELEEEVEEEVREWSDDEGEDENGVNGSVEQAYKELQVDKEAIPDAVEEFK
ncbi:hypothetical protein EC991_002964 [Linnemannia zychae]|nr:hypothetical protein EC991_002964 [Linnemannia zychae]